MKSKKIFFENLAVSNQFFTKKFKKNYSIFIKKGKYILSDFVKQFENNFAHYHKLKFCVGVGNGLDALTISLKSLNLEKNSEVLVASNSYVACIMSILNANLMPVLVEPEIRTYNIDVSEVVKKITKKTRVVMAVNMYGKPCDLISLKKICKHYGLYLVEDCAQSHGATINNKMTGTFGDLGCFSFYPTKNLGSLGDAGAIICNKKDLYWKIRKIRNYGSEKKYYNEIQGINSRLDEFQAAFLNIKLKYLNKINNHKIKLASIYNKYLKNDFIKPLQQINIKDVYHIYNIRHSKRDKLKKFLLDNNIITDIHYPISPNKQPCFKGLFKSNFPISDEIHRTTLSLPISFAHTENEIYRVTEVLNSFK
jgi:dTDP-4-amino-4,6-dideoxygalactose transaminase